MSPEPVRRILGENGLAALEAIAIRAEAARRLELGSSKAVLRSIVDATVTLFEANAASIALYDPSTDRLVFTVAAGEQGRGVVGLSIPAAQGVAGYVFTMHPRLGARAGRARRARCRSAI